jgi:uncharacterized protein (TIGR03083 family)
MQNLIADERRDLAAVLAGLTPDQWEAPSLCGGWRVREVAAHLSLPFRYSTAQVLLGILQARGSFDRMADQRARADAAALTTEQLTAAILDNADVEWKPPGGGLAGALSHDVIHGLDITVALGLPRRVPHDRLQIVLDGLATPKRLKTTGVDLSGVQLCADDLDWTFGTGTPVTGSAQDLLLVLAGRTLPPGHLHGELTTRFVRSSRRVGLR